MLHNTTINNDIDLYYQLGTNKNNKGNEVNIVNKVYIRNNSNKPNKIKFDIDYENESSSSSDIDTCDYEKMIEDIYNCENIDNEEKRTTNSPDNIYDYSNNYNIEYDDFILNNNNNNSKMNSFKNNNKNVKKRVYCEDCGSDDIIEDTTHGILVCTGCGQVISSLMDCGAEWSQYNDDNKKDMNRCSHPISQLLPQSSMATTIAGSFSSRIKTLHGWSAMPYKERSLNEVFKIIQAKCAKGKIMKCIEDDAKIMYKNIAECKHLIGKNLGKSVITRGKNRTSVIAACILFACKKKDKSRGAKEFAKLFGLEQTEITKGCKIFQKLAKKTNIELKLNLENPEQYIIRFCEELRVKKIFTNQAIQISNNVQKLQIASSHNPTSLATGSIYMMCILNRLSISKKIIAEKFNVSHVTIDKAYKKLEPFTNLLTNNELCDRLSVEIVKYQENIVLTDKLKTQFIRFNIDIEKTFDPKYNTNTLFNVMITDSDGNCKINNELIIEHTIEINDMLRRTENEFIKLNLNFTEDLYQMNILK